MLTSPAPGAKPPTSARAVPNTVKLSLGLYLAVIAISVIVYFAVPSAHPAFPRIDDVGNAVVVGLFAIPTIAAYFGVVHKAYRR